MLPYVGRALSNIFRKPATERFPKTDAPEPAKNYRGRLSYDSTKSMCASGHDTYNRGC